MGESGKQTDSQAFKKEKGVETNQNENERNVPVYMP